MNIRISNKAIELNNQNSQKLEMFLSITARMAGELHPQKERLSSSFTLVNKSDFTFHPKTMKSELQQLYELKIYRLEHMQHSHPSLPAKALKFWPPAIRSGSLDRASWGGGTCCTVAVWAVQTLCRSAPLYVTDRQGNIFKEPTWSLKTKRHVILAPACW